MSFFFLVFFLKKIFKIIEDTQIKLLSIKKVQKNEIYILKRNAKNVAFFVDHVEKTEFDFSSVGTGSVAKFANGAVDPH